MAEYIEREALIKKIMDDPYRADSTKRYYKCLVKIRPAADVVEVRHGEWMDNGDRDRNGAVKPFAISCSVCGSSAGTSWMKYCPNCGAKMDGATDTNVGGKMDGKGEGG